MRATANILFEIGDRVCLSKLGESRIRKPRSKAGKVVGFGFSEARVRVLFDGLRRPTTLHHSYLNKQQDLARHTDETRAVSDRIATLSERALQIDRAFLADCAVDCNLDHEST